MKITGEEFVELIEKNPSWCKTITEPLKVTTYVDLIKSEITHLSPLLTFNGKNSDGWAADFDHCKNLKVATGTFNGIIDFSGSGIEKIENLTVTVSNDKGESADFHNCKNLKIATGTYAGAVYFTNSGVTTIKNLIIKSTKKSNKKAWFLDCKIKYVPKEYRGKEYIFNNNIIKASISTDAINKIKAETNNIEI